MPGAEGAVDRMVQISKEDVLDSLEEASGISNIDLDASFADLGLDSLMIIEWISMFEEKFDASVDIEHLDFSKFSGLNVSQVIEKMRKLAIAGSTG